MPVKKTTKSGLTIDVLDSKGAVSGVMELPKAIFDAKINPVLMAQAVRVYLSNQRRGTVHTKSRGQVKGSSRKIYQQKGTGRARHGSIRAPIFVHGGVAHGPKQRDYSLKLSQKMKQIALFSALSEKRKEGKIVVASGLSTITPKTKVVVAFLKKAAPQVKQSVLLVIEPNADILKRAARNISNVHLLQASQLHTYAVISSDTLVFTKEAIEALTKRALEEK